jgi:hypothetical protein
MSKQSTGEVWWSARQIMDRYQVSRNTIDRWRARGGFPDPSKEVNGRRYWKGTDLDAWDQATMKRGRQVEVA